MKCRKTGKQKIQKVSRFWHEIETKALIENVRHVSLDTTFIDIPTKCYTKKCNIKGAVLAQKIFMNIECFAYS